MKRFFAICFIGMGIFLVFLSCLLGFGFAAIYLMGAIGTGGREAIGELFTIVVITGIGIVFGLILLRLGRILSQGCTNIVTDSLDDDIT